MTLIGAFYTNSHISLTFFSASSVSESNKLGNIMQDTLQSIYEELNKNCAITEYLNQQQKENNENYVKLMRKKWWLLNPNIVEISYVAVYKTDYSTHDPSYPYIAWHSMMDINGEDVLWKDAVMNTNGYPALESEITDEETVITIRNPYSQSPKG
jgi:hypothetical protein